MSQLLEQPAWNNKIMKSAAKDKQHHSNSVKNGQVNKNLLVISILAVVLLGAVAALYFLTDTFAGKAFSTGVLNSAGLDLRAGFDLLPLNTARTYSLKANAAPAARISGIQFILDFDETKLSLGNSDASCQQQVLALLDALFHFDPANDLTLIREVACNSGVGNVRVNYVMACDPTNNCNNLLVPDAAGDVTLSQFPFTGIAAGPADVFFESLEIYDANSLPGTAAISLNSPTRTSPDQITVHPAAETVCDNNADDDRDGQLDCADSDCSGNAACATQCTDSDGGRDINIAGQITYSSGGTGGSGGGGVASDTCRTGAQIISDYTAEGETPPIRLNPTQEYLMEFTCDVNNMVEFIVCPAGTSCQNGACAAALPGTETICNNGRDDDGDALIDCADTDCSGNAACAIAPPSRTALSSCGAPAGGWQANTEYTLSEDVILDVSGTVRACFDFGSVNGVTLDCQGKTIKSSLKGAGYGIKIGGSQAKVINCRFENLVRGIEVSGAVATNFQIEENEFAGNSEGIGILGARTGLINNNLFLQNGNGIFIRESQVLAVSLNMFFGSGFSVVDSSGITFEGNEIEGDADNDGTPDPGSVTGFSITNGQNIGFWDNYICNFKYPPTCYGAVFGQTGTNYLDTAYCNVPGALSCDSTVPRCTGSVPANANLCTDDDAGLTADTARALVPRCTAAKCEYTCDMSTELNAGRTACIVPAFSCTGDVPAYADLCAGDAKGLTANMVRTAVALCTDNKCEYACRSGYPLNTAKTACEAVASGCASHAQCTDASRPQCDASSGNCVPCNTDGACINNPTFGGNMRCSNGACVQLNSVQEGGVCISSGACKSGLVCRGGFCTLDCGNGVLDAGEQCDDGNTDATDGCTNQCRTNICGDGIIRTGIEYCDDGNTAAADGCSATCSIESGWSCLTPGQACVETGGAGLLGDVNGDGSVDLADAIDIARFDLGIFTSPTFNAARGDVTCNNGTVDIADAILIARVDLGILGFSIPNSCP